MICATFAFGPRTAIFPLGSAKGRIASFFSKTAHSAPARRIRARCSGLSSVTSLYSGISSRTPTRAIRRSILRASPRMVPFETSPASMAAISFSPRSRVGPGISRPNPALIVAVVVRDPNQSDMTMPSNPHSPRNTSVRSQLLSAV